MSLRAGTPRAWLRPTDPAAQHRLGARGDHRGPHAALNVKNARPGYTYYYEANKPSKIQSKLNDGWEFVRQEDPEQWGADLPADVQQSLDTARPYKDVILLRIPNHKYAEIQRRKLEDAKFARTGAERSYLNTGEDRARQLGRSAPAQDLYFQRPTHYVGEE